MIETEDEPFQFETSRKKTAIEEPTRSTFTADDGSHLDTFDMPEPDDGGPVPDAPIPIGEDGEPVRSPERIDTEGFWIAFQAIFDLPGTMIDRGFAPLAIQPEEKDTARRASDATYALLSIYYPRALEPNSETLGHLIYAVPFFIGKARLAAELIRQRREYREQQSSVGRSGSAAASPERGQVATDDPPAPSTRERASASMPGSDALAKIEGLDPVAR